MLDLSALQDKLAATLSKELDEALPDGIIQKVAGEALKLVGETLVEAGQSLVK